MADYDVSNEKALIIEERNLNLSVLFDALDVLGITSIKVVENAERGIEECSKTKFDLILCTTALHKGLTANQFFEVLREKKLIGLATTFVSIDTDDELSVVYRLFELQADAIICAPISAKKLVDAIKAALIPKIELKFIYDVLSHGNLDVALKIISTRLAACDQAELLPALMKMKGDILLSFERWQEAIVHFRQVLRNHYFAWAKIGLVDAYIHNDQPKHAAIYLNQLLLQPETKAMAYALLSELQLKSKEYKEAFDAILTSSALSPFNLERQSSLLNLSRLNHDYDTQLKASKAILKLSQETHHDNPQTYLNVIRASIDHAMTHFDEDQSQDLNTTTLCLKAIASRFPNEDLTNQIKVVNARLHHLNNQSDQAKGLIAEVLANESETLGAIEDELDKAKACHQLGLLDTADQIFTRIQAYLQAHSEEEPSLVEYIDQEKAERLRFPKCPKELNDDAMGFLQNKEYLKAFDALSTALTVLPDNISIAQNLLQTIADSPELDKQDGKVKMYIQQCLAIFSNKKLNEAQRAWLQQIKPSLEPKES